MSSELLEPLVGAVGGLIGALLGGLIAFLTLRAQLRHEAKEKERDRKLTLRRDVYLGAVEAIGKSQLYLGSFSREDYDTGKLLDQLRDLPGALSKAQLVGSEATFEALDQFGDFMISSSIELLTLRVSMDRVQTDIAERQEQISQLEQRCSSLQAILQEPSNDPKHAEISSELLMLQDELSSVRVRTQELYGNNLEAVKQLGRAAAGATLLAQIEAGKVVMHMRREIELPLDEKWYMDQLLNRFRRLRSKIDEAYKNVENSFESEASPRSANPAPQADV